MRIVWWRHKRTGTAHAFQEGEWPMCGQAEKKNMGRKAQGGIKRCKLCEKAIRREKKRKKYPWLS